MEPKISNPNGDDYYIFIAHKLVKKEQLNFTSLLRFRQLNDKQSGSPDTLHYIIMVK